MVGSICVEPGQLAAARMQVCALAQELRAGLDCADADVAALLAGGWTGSAAQAFDQAWQQWRSGSVQVLDALAETADLLLAGAQAYERQEESTRLDFARLAAS